MPTLFTKRLRVSAKNTKLNSFDRMRIWIITAGIYSIPSLVHHNIFETKNFFVLDYAPESTTNPFDPVVRTVKYLISFFLSSYIVRTDNIFATIERTPQLKSLKVKFVFRNKIILKTFIFIQELDNVLACTHRHSSKNYAIRLFRLNGP